MEETPQNEPLQTLRVDVNIHTDDPISDGNIRRPSSPGSPSNDGTSRVRDLGGSPRGPERGQHANGDVPGSPHSRSSSPGGRNGTPETSIGVEPPQPSGKSFTKQFWFAIVVVPIYHFFSCYPLKRISFILGSQQSTHFRPWLSPSKSPSSGRQSQYHPYRRVSTTGKVDE